jgi:hypothetical protein
MAILMGRWRDDDCPEKRFHMCYMDWSEFAATIHSPNTRREQWLELCSVDCIIGGLDMDMPYMSVLLV